MSIENRLEVVRNLQIKHKDAHLGGSLGLYLHGIDLKRDLENSDIDLTIPYPLPENEAVEYAAGSNREDFDYTISSKENYFINVDIRVDKTIPFTIIYKNGFGYKVTQLSSIIDWKKKYADKGVSKHIDDLLVIAGGERRIEQLDELPF